MALVTTFGVDEFVFCVCLCANTAGQEARTLSH